MTDTEAVDGQTAAIVVAIVLVAAVACVIVVEIFFDVFAFMRFCFYAAVAAAATDVVRTYRRQK